MLNRQKLITLQALYLKIDQLSDNELKNVKYDMVVAMDFISFKENGKSSLRPSLHQSEIYALNLIGEKIAFMLLRDFNLMMEFIYELWTDQEIEQIVTEDQYFKETPESIVIQFEMEKKHHFNLMRSHLFKEAGISVLESNHSNCIVAITKKDMAKYALQIIDNNPIEYLET